MELTINNHKTTISQSNIHIENSYEIKDTHIMRKYLEIIKKEIDKYEDMCEIFNKRTIKSLINEWRTHNLLYSLHLFRKHTKDVDLNNIKWYHNILYTILSVFYINK